MTPQRRRLVRNVRGLMDALFATCLLIFLVNTFMPELGSEWTTGERRALYGARTTWAAACLSLWLLLRRSGRTLWLVALGVLGVLGTGMDEYDMMFVICVLVFVYRGRRAGFTLAGIGSFLLLVAVAAMPGMGWLDKAYLAAQTLTTFLVPVLLGLALDRLAASALRLETANREQRLATRELAARASLAQDVALAEERARAARELHDGLGHQLTIAGMSLDYALHMLPTDTHEAHTEARNAREIIARAAEDARGCAEAASAEAAPPRLLGLDHLVQGFREVGLRVRVTGSTVGLDPALELFVTRFVQEGLTNALRHARAQHAWVDIGFDRDRLEVTVRNDGHCPAVVRDGFGLRSLRERSQDLGGELTARVLDGQFVVQAVLPPTRAVAEVA